MTGRLPASWRTYPPVERVAYHLARVRAWARRVTAPGLAVRAVVWLVGLLALLLALPGPLRLGPGLPAAALLALLPALSPAGTWVSTVQVLAVGSVAVRVGAGAAEPSLPELLLLGAALYAHHTAAALAAQLRTDTVVPLPVFRHWAVRAGLVLAGSTAVSLAIVAVAGPAAAGRDTGNLALGVAAAVALIAAVSWLLYRRPG